MIGVRFSSSNKKVLEYEEVEKSVQPVTSAFISNESILFERKLIESKTSLKFSKNSYNKEYLRICFVFLKSKN